MTNISSSSFLTFTPPYSFHNIYFYFIIFPNLFFKYMIMIPMTSNFFYFRNIILCVKFTDRFSNQFSQFICIQFNFLFTRLHFYFIHDMSFFILKKGNVFWKNSYIHIYRLQINMFNYLSLTSMEGNSSYFVVVKPIYTQEFSEVWYRPN